MQCPCLPSGREWATHRGIVAFSDMLERNRSIEACRQSSCIRNVVARLLLNGHVVRALFTILCTIVLLVPPVAELAARPRAGRQPNIIPLPDMAPQQVQEVLQGLPSMVALHRQVLVAADLTNDDAAEWRRRARLAAALPQLAVGYRHTFQDHLDWSVKDSISVSGSGVVIGPRTSDVQERSDRNNAIEVRAVWALDELVYTPATLQVSQEARQRRAEIRELLHLATQWYAEWQRLRLTLLASGARRARAGVVAAGIRSAEVVGELDGLTDGWFSRAIDGKGVAK